MSVVKNSLLVAVLSTLAFGASSKVDLKELQKQVAQLQGQVAELKAAQSKNDTSKMQEQIDELYERADETELQAALSKVKMGLDFTVGGASVHTKSNGVKTNNENKWATEVHLNLNAKINDRTRFTGRLAMAKYWGNIGNSVFVKDFEAGKNPQGNSSVYLDRAYVDYDIIPSTFIATIGRQPGTDGPGSNLRNNSVRMSTYPALLVNAMGDALVLTYKPEALKDYNVAMRAGYIRFYQGSEVDGNTARHLGLDKYEKDSNLYLAMVEGELPLGSFGKNLLMLSYVYADKYSMPIYQGTSTNAGALPLIDKVFNMGSSHNVNLHFESNNMFGSPFSWFLSLGYYKGVKAIDNEQAIRDNIAGNLSIAPTIGTMMAPLIPQAPMVAAAAVKRYQDAVIQSGAMKWNEKNAWSVHIGARYDFTQAFKLGLEYFHGSKYWYAMSRPGVNDPLDFRNTRGNVYDIYAIWQLDMNQYLRFAYTHIDYKYSNSGRPIGGAERVDDKANVFSVIYNLRF